MVSGVWQRVGPVATGGTVFNVADDGCGRPVLATPAGLFSLKRTAEAAWQAGWDATILHSGLSMPSALIAVGKTLVAGSALGQIAYSTDGGESWYAGRIPALRNSPPGGTTAGAGSHGSEPQSATIVPGVTCLAASPDFERDGVLLAGTQGAGILRSSDAGRSWQFSSFGLHDLTVLALTMAPTWGPREVVFAGTPGGLYRSPNGGRAWKLFGAGLEERVILSLAVSPGFEQDGLMWAGTEASGLLRSTDRGKTWDYVDLGPEADPQPPINALWMDPEFADCPHLSQGHRTGAEHRVTPICLAGTGDGRIFRSADGGASWHPSEVALSGPEDRIGGDAPILCLSQSPGTNVAPCDPAATTSRGRRLYAGLHDQGLLVSDDEGQTWLGPALSVRALTRWAHPGTAAGFDDGSLLYAWGPLEGAWFSGGAPPGMVPDPRTRPQTGDGDAWTRLAGLGDALPLLTLAAAPVTSPPLEERLFAGTSRGFWLSRNGGRTWEVVATDNVSCVAFSPRFGEDGRVWAGTDEGRLLASTDGGLCWQSLNGPAPATPLVAIGAQSRPGEDEAFVAVTFNAGQKRIAVWKSHAWPGGGCGDDVWIPWLEEYAAWPAAQLSLGEGEEAILCLDHACWRATPSGWEKILDADDRILKVSCLSGERDWLVLTSRQILYLDQERRQGSAVAAEGYGGAFRVYSHGLPDEMLGRTLVDLFAVEETTDHLLAYVLVSGGLVWHWRLDL